MMCLHKVLGSNLDECVIACYTNAQYMSMYIMANVVKFFFDKIEKNKNHTSCILVNFVPFD
jgi:hypothetical protein